MFDELSSWEADDLRKRMEKLQRLLGDEPEDAALKSTMAARGRDSQGRKIDKPFGAGPKAEPIRRDARGYRINKPFAPPKTGRY